jgi:hypothetical protein
LSVVLYGCETWSVTLREEHGVRMSESGVLWEIFESKREQVCGEWRKFHTVELRDFYSTDVS